MIKLPKTEDTGTMRNFSEGRKDTVGPQILAGSKLRFPVSREKEAQTKVWPGQIDFTAKVIGGWVVQDSTGEAQTQEKTEG